MATAERVESLRAKHAALEARISEEILHPYQDDDEISRLKREKLRLKDEITRLAADA
jgi:hypothetical protein